MKTKRVLCWPLIAGMLAGCGSGASHPLTPVTVASAPGGASTASLRKASVSIVIPRRSASGSSRRRSFVSPSTQGVSVEVTHATGGVIDYDVTTNFNVSENASSTCTGSSPEVCTLQIPAPVAPSPDFDSFAFTLYDQPPGGSTNMFGSSAQTIGTGSSTASIAANTANSISAYIDGIPSSVQFVLDGSTQIIASGDGYLGFTAPIGAQALDVDLDALTGAAYDPYVPAFALDVSEPQPPAGSTTLALAQASTTGLSPAPPTCNAAASGVQSVTTCRSTDVITTSYLQTASKTFDTSYYATVSSGTAAVVANTPVYIAPIFVLDTTDPATSTSGASFAQGAPGVSPLLALNGETGTVVPTEYGATVEGTSLTFAANVNSGCNGVIASSGITQSSSGKFSIPGVPLASQTDAGGCIVTFSDGIGGTVELAVSDTPAGSTQADARRRHATQEYRTSGRTVRR